MAVTALIGRKAGMTSVFDEAGAMLGVTVLAIEPNRVLGRRTAERDGYDAVVLQCGERRESRVSRPQKAEADKAGLPAAGELVREVRCSGDTDVDLGAAVGVADVFEDGQWVDVVGTSRGHGFQGVRKRHHFSYGPASHGSKNYKEPGSTGHSTYPGRVFKGKRMAGRHGGKRRTVRNLRIVKVDAENGRILVAGPVPGCDTSFIVIRHAVAKLMPKGE